MHKVLPFHANISNSGSSQEVATAVERLIESQASDGWEFVQIQELTTSIAGSSGCFGLGATPGTTASMSVLIFKKP